MTTIAELRRLLGEKGWVYNGNSAYAMGQRVVFPFHFGAAVEGDGTDTSTGESISDEENEQSEMELAEIIVAAVNALPTLLDAAEAADALLLVEDTNPGWDRENLDFEDLRAALDKLR